jgi:hypothetical protein
MRIGFYLTPFWSPATRSATALSRRGDPDAGGRDPALTAAAAEGGR